MISAIHLCWFCSVYPGGLLLFLPRTEPYRQSKLYANWQSSLTIVVLTEMWVFFPSLKTEAGDNEADQHHSGSPAPLLCSRWREEQWWGGSWSGWLHLSKNPWLVSKPCISLHTSLLSLHCFIMSFWTCLCVCVCVCVCMCVSEQRN